MAPQSTQFRWIAFLAVAAVLCFTLSYSNTWDSTRSTEEVGAGGWTPHLSSHARPPSIDSPSSICSAPQASEVFHTVPVDSEWDSSRLLRGPPTEKFRDNLLDDVDYITAWSNAGFTNQFMSYANMIYLGMLSDRVPIIPPFAPDHHITQQAGTVPFGKVFNLTRARQSMRQALLEWHEVKALPNSTTTETPHPHEQEQLGCWSTRHESDRIPMRVPSMLNHLRFDISYTRIPGETRNVVWSRDDDFVDFGHIVPYIFPGKPLRHPSGSYGIMHDSPMGHRLDPDEQMSCFDFLYYATSSHETFEWKFPWSPAWRRVATHMHFTDELVDTVKGYLSRMLKSPEDAIPPFITVHIRRGDFRHQCASGPCYIPLEKYRGAVEDIREQIRRKQNREVKEVVVMSDEKDPNFWAEIKSLGWSRIDHRMEKTHETHGEWYPPIFDQVAQSMAAGFVGTESSTYSLVGARRVEDWNNGPYIEVMRDRTLVD